jgi:hypothetical protein
VSEGWGQEIAFFHDRVSIVLLSSTLFADVVIHVKGIPSQQLSVLIDKTALHEIPRLFAYNPQDHDESVSSST